ncbi:MAG: hypothetical protein WD407_03955 [Rhodospirillales bacterium]
MTGGLEHSMRRFLTDLASRRGTVTYRVLAKALDLAPPHTIHKIGDALAALMAEDHANARPFLAALVISKARNGLPSPHFFDIAGGLGRYTGPATGAEAHGYHTQELERAWDYWGAPQKASSEH